MFVKSFMKKDALIVNIFLNMKKSWWQILGRNLIYTKKFWLDMTSSLRVAKEATRGVL